MLYNETACELFSKSRSLDITSVGGGGYKPRGIEEVPYEHPKVAHAAVVGLPDPHTGESVKAFIQLKPNAQVTEEEILGFCKERMAGYKRPRSVHFRDALPMSAVGKVLRRVLREEERRKHSSFLLRFAPQSDMPFRGPRVGISGSKITGRSECNVIR